ncbi:DUF1801 domain-containing protein [Mucilaginibacter terrenus]|uniref:DUF1801 domain-containing protein n=1 Tax=Mucilaginibacter terrenus TaxID=2482727 RepID=A0A3E2NXD5_9SPHI|nr:DUF1801 domain-containing protein [Mucilaginibacter terrenus]RFZ85684.1 DUF1801 domain-containing protein [Mucilaginibacter terrenus]
MYKLKTQLTNAALNGFLDTIANDAVRQDCLDIAEMIQVATGHPAAMWGTTIVGFGTYKYKYASGHEGEMCQVGFSPRKANISLYLHLGCITDNLLLNKLGKYKVGKGCLYIKKLADVDVEVFKNIIALSVKHVRETYSLS